jgi:hypothetical protein
MFYRPKASNAFGPHTGDGFNSPCSRRPLTLPTASVVRMRIRNERLISLAAHRLPTSPPALLDELLGKYSSGTASKLNGISRFWDVFRSLITRGVVEGMRVPLL